MAFSRTVAMTIQSALTTAVGRDDSDGYDTRWELTAVWNDGNDYWCFHASADESLFRQAYAFLKPLLTGTGVPLYSRIIPSWDDGGECEVLEALAL